MADSEEQRDEILALQSIYEESQFHVDTSNDQAIVGYVFIKPEINGKLKVGATKNGEEKQITVEHLCPIELHFAMPVNYPSVDPPNFTLVCKWLRRNQVLFEL